MNKVRNAEDLKIHPNAVRSKGLGSSPNQGKLSGSSPIGWPCLQWPPKAVYLMPLDRLLLTPSNF